MIARHPFKKYILFVLICAYPFFVSAAGTVVENSEYLYSKAMTFKAEAKYKEAIELLLEVEKKGESLDRVYYQISNCYQLLSEYPQSLEYARKSISKNPRYTEPYVLMFDVYLTLKNNEGAAEVLSSLLDVHPDQYQYQYTLGILYYQNIENYRLAAESFNKVLEYSKKNPIPTFYKEQSNIILSDIYNAQKEYVKAIEYLDDAVKINPRNNSRFYRYATAFLSNGYYDYARISMEHFLSNIPENQKNNPLVKNLYSYLANIYYITDDPKMIYYLRLGSSKDTIEGVISRELFHFETQGKGSGESIVEKLNSSEFAGYAAPHLTLAKEYSRQKNIEKAYQNYFKAGTLLAKTDLLSSAARFFLEAHKLKSDEKEPIGYLAQIYEQLGNKRLAVIYYTKYLTLSPDLEVSLHLGYLYELLGEKPKCDSIIDAVIKENDKAPRPYFIKGLIQNRREKFEDAEISFKKGLEFRIDDPVFYYYLATAQEKNGKKRDAETSLKKALELDKQNASYKNFLGYMYADENINLDEAVKLIEDALKQDPFNGAYLDSLGWAFFKQGKNDLALKKLLLAAKMLELSGENDPVIYDHLGDVYNVLGKKDKAIKAWKKSISIKKDTIVEQKIMKAGAK